MIVETQPVTDKTTDALIREWSNLEFWTVEMPKRIEKQQMGILRALDPERYLARMNEDIETLEQGVRRLKEVKAEIKRREA
jgi:hypothetical protein